MGFKIKKTVNKVTPKEPKESAPIHGVDNKGGGFKERKSVTVRLCRCYNSPQGDYGLNGFFGGKTYHCQDMGLDKQDRPYHRVYPDYHINPKHFYNILTFNFQYYFKREGLDFFEGSPPSRSSRK